MKIQELFEAEELSEGVKMPPSLPDELKVAIEASPGVAKVIKNADGIKISVNHHNGYMEYHYTMSDDGDLRVTWNGYQSAGGEKQLIKKNPAEALAMLVKKIKTQGKAQTK